MTDLAHILVDYVHTKIYQLLRVAPGVTNQPREYGSFCVSDGRLVRNSN